MTATPLRILAFPGAPNLPVFAALEHGMFAAEGLEVAFSTTPSSVFQAEALARGDCDVAFTAFDNVVAYTEGQGAAAIDGDPGFRVLMGATQLRLSLVVAPEIESYEDLRGRSLALDALATGFAFVLYEMLARAGLGPDDCALAAVGATPQRWQSVKSGTHVGTLTIEPFTSIARRDGFRVLDDSGRLFDSYQGGIVAARLEWARANRPAVEALIRGYLKGLGWTLAPANREAARALLLARMPDLRPEAAEPVLNSLLSPDSGLTPGAEILPAGMRQVLDLRSRHAGGPRLDDIGRYLHLDAYRAVTGRSAPS